MNSKPRLFFKAFGIFGFILISLTCALAFSYMKTGSLPFGGAPERVNFLLLGLDEDKTRTDVVIAGSFLTNSGELRILSVPRDTYAVMPEERLVMVKSYNAYAPDDGVMKLTEVRHYAGKENGAKYVTAQVEELLGVTFDYYMEIDLEGFRQVIDALGGVEFDVPTRMTRDDPYINLYPGKQLLDGAAAEQLVRFRGYASADKGRVNTQQQFLKALISRLSENGMKSLPSIAFTLAKCVDTNFPLADTPKYIKYAKNFNADNIKTYVLPTSPYWFRNKAFEKLDARETAEIAREVFFEKGLEDSFSETIRVLNGGRVNGLAAKKRDALIADGYNVTDIGDYHGSENAKTRIIVRQNGIGDDLRRYFDDPIVETNKNSLTDEDILIVLGTEEGE